jgi:hypothetical protein
MERIELRRTTGGVNIIRFGAGPNGLTRTLGQYMVGSAATFGYVIFGLATGNVTDRPCPSFFMSIGSVIRTGSTYSHRSVCEPGGSLFSCRGSITGDLKVYKYSYIIIVSFGSLNIYVQ